MSKVISAAQIMQLKVESTAPSALPELEALVAPTADDLMELTLAAFTDVEPQLDLDEAQSDALRAALQARLIAVLTGQVPTKQATNT